MECLQRTRQYSIYIQGKEHNGSVLSINIIFIPLDVLHLERSLFTREENMGNEFDSDIIIKNF